MRGGCLTQQVPIAGQLYLRWEVPGLLAPFSPQITQYFRTGSAKKNFKRLMGGSKWRENEQLIVPIPPSHNLAITNP